MISLFYSIIYNYTGCFVTCEVWVTSGVDYTPKNNEKKSHKYMSYLSSFMRYNEFSVLIIFTKDAENDQLAFEDKPARVLSFIWWLLSLPFLVFLEFVGSLALFYFVVFQHVRSIFRRTISSRRGFHKLRNTLYI